MSFASKPPRSQPSQIGKLISIALFMLVACLVAYFGRSGQSDGQQENPIPPSLTESPHEPTSTSETPASETLPGETRPPETRNSESPSPRENSTPRTEPPNTPRNTSSEQRTNPSGKTRPAPVTVDNVTIKDVNGRVVYRGAVELQGTLDRIGQKRKLRYSHDGATFENREGRLPRKDAGYYTEWIHPTAKLDGPGPQRVVTGRDGDVYYTADHYRTFKQLKQPAGALGPSANRNDKGLQNPNKPEKSPNTPRGTSPRNTPRDQ